MATNGQTTQTPVDDPFESAGKATLAPRSYYGEVQIDCYYCILEKGKGKLVFDAQQHSTDQRRTAIKISLLPLAEQNVQFALERDTVAESREWAGIIWPSAKALGLSNPRELNGKWAKMQQVPSGRTYRNAKGEEKEATTFKFLALYGSEAECRAAYMADGGGQTPLNPPADGGTGNGHGAPATNGASAAAPAGNGKSALDVARPFIAAFAKQNQYDIEATRKACRAQAIITRAIDVDSDAFVQLVAEAMAATTGGK